MYLECRSVSVRVYRSNLSVSFQSALEANTFHVFVTISSIAFDCVLGTFSLRFLTRVYNLLNSLGQ